MILNRIEPGTECTIRGTNLRGKVNKVFFYPTKFEIEFPDGRIEHLTSKDIDFDGVVQQKPSLKVASIPEDSIGQVWSSWSPFISESTAEHHFSTTKEIMWRMLISLEMYNVWFYGIQRSLPILNEPRFVHKYSFSKLKLAPGAYFKVRPKTLAPWFTCRIMTLEENKKFGFTFRTNPFVQEYVSFTISESDRGVWVACKRISHGISSIINQIGWQNKSKDLQRLAQIVPKTSFQTEEKNVDIKEENTSTSEGLNSLSKEQRVAYFVNKGLDGEMDAINKHDNKVIRGKAKAMIVKINRGQLERPPMPSVSNDSIATQTDNSGGSLKSLSKDDMVAYLANKGIDGDMDLVHNHNDKVIRGKAKAMIIKINRGQLEKPPMPDLDSTENNQDISAKETEEEKIERLVTIGLDGDMDEINSLTNKVLRGKIKAAIIKAKRTQK